MCTGCRCFHARSRTRSAQHGEPHDKGHLVSSRVLTSVESTEHLDGLLVPQEVNAWSPRRSPEKGTSRVRPNWQRARRSRLASFVGPGYKEIGKPGSSVFRSAD